MAPTPASDLVTTVRELLEPVVQDAGLFLEDIQVTRAGKYSTVRVIVDLEDGPGAIDLDRVAEVTTPISEALDAADPVPGQYTLEVTSPGAERDLVTPRHWRRSVGLPVVIEIADADSHHTLSGELVSAEPVTVLTEEGSTQVDLATVRRARTTVVL